MRNIAFLIMIIFSISFAKSENKKIAIFEFKPKGVTSSEASIVTDMFRTAMAELDIYDIVDRENIKKLLKEQALQYAGVTDEKDAVQLGKILNIKYMVVGSFMKLKSKFYISASLINVESAKVIKSSQVELTNVEKIGDSINLITEKLTGQKSNKKFASYVEKGFGILSVRSFPLGADVYIDGEYVGKTKLFKKIKPGQHIILIKSEGFFNKKLIEEITEGQTKEINIILTKGVGLEEAKKMKGIYLSKLIRNSIFASLSIGGIFTGLAIGDNFDKAGDDEYNQYLGANISKDIFQLNKTYQRSYNNADQWYYLAETSLGLSVVFMTFSILDFIKFHYYSTELKKGIASSFDIIPVIGLDKSYGLTLSYRF